MTLPVGRNGSSGSRTGVLYTLCCRGKELLQLCVCARTCVYSVCLFTSFNTCTRSAILELHICLLKFVKPSVFLSLSSFSMCVGMNVSFTFCESI